MKLLPFTLAMFLFLVPNQLRAQAASNDDIDSTLYDDAGALIASRYMADFIASLRGYFAGFGLSDEEISTRLDPIIELLQGCVIGRLAERSRDSAVDIEYALQEFVSSNQEEPLVYLHRKHYETEAKSCVLATKALWQNRLGAT
jgi:hypothetical protein